VGKKKHQQNVTNFRGAVDARGSSFGSGDLTNRWNESQRSRQPESAEGAGAHTGSQRLAFERRLSGDWLQLAVVLDIPDHERRRFPQGEEAHEIWTHLEVRDRLDQLPTALRDIGRDDLARLLGPEAV
jgi:hypothetical protein